MAHAVSNRLRNIPPPTIKVKKEPSSPNLPTARPRPRKLDLSANMSSSQAALSSRPSAPLTSKESAGLAIQDVGLACLSPGFHTQDPTMREQLQRSIDVRDRQRQIIEARQKSGKPSLDGSEGPSGKPFGFDGGAKTPGTGRRKGPPPGLSIAPPSHQQFASERVIQSAPLNQSFTGLRPQHPYSRHVANQPSNLSQTSHIHHVPATQTNNRLPPLADVFASDNLGPPSRDSSRNGPSYAYSPGHSSHSNHPPPLPSPGFLPPQQPAQAVGPAPSSARPREYRSAEEAVHVMSGGREELLPKIVHYGGHQPPTPPSPMPPQSQSQSQYQQQQQQRDADAQQHPHLQQQQQQLSHAPAPAYHDPSRRASASGVSSGSTGVGIGNGRRRNRDEYERDAGSPPPPPLLRPNARTNSNPLAGPGVGLGTGRQEGAGGAETEAQRRKKEEFLGLCERAWDLFHS
ncbi:hypothetical protein B0A49_12012 [Cryomyces minteri]|uniref:Uncharacterized protein n=1 Tax=Cryomyces minteri TaxID=331657 RepID=A0A4U0W0V2_9PEZI|nr:hypothetical protein B0A49_12012 [Cryomyces minteri]